MSIDIALPIVRLGDYATIGPTHHLIGHPRGRGRIGAFEFDRLEPGDAPINLALWAAIAEEQQRIIVLPTHTGTAIVDDVRPIAATRSRLLISRNFRMTSQALAAAVTREPCLGGNAWTTLAVPDQKGLVEALALWLNGSLGMTLRWGYGQSTQRGRSLIKINALADLPVPDFSAQSDAAQLARTTAIASFDELAGRRLQPASYAWIDEARHQIDEVVLQMLGIDSDAPKARREVGLIRELWCREPSVHGGKRDLLRRLGID